MKSLHLVLLLSFKVLVLYLLTISQFFVEVANNRLRTFDVAFQAHYVPLQAAYTFARLHC